MGDIAIKAENLSKRYHIGALRQRHDLLRDLLAYRMKSLLRRNAPPGPGANTIWALQDVSLEIKKGEAIGIIGRNGSGKSTLLKILSRITEPTTGRAAMHGRFCSLLEVGTGFHSELTGRDNIYLSGAILGMKKEEIDRKFDEIVAFAEVEKFIDTPIKHYSSGMQVRLGFAVAAHLEPEILIVDEVLAVGDWRFQKKCMNKICDARRSGQTVIFVSHDMSAISRLCERAILLDEGRVIRDGSPHDVVGEYLCSGHMTPVREWPELEVAPGNEIVRICAIRVRTANGRVTDTVEIHVSIGIEIEYEVLQRGHLLVPSFGFRNEQGIDVFVVFDRDPAWRRRPRPKGRFVSTAWIPGNFLTEGTLIVGGGIVTEAPFHIHCDVPEAVAFHVLDRGEGESARGDVTENWIGVVRPLLKWTTQHSFGVNK